MKRLSGAAMTGNYLVLLFLASNGAHSVVQNIVRVGPVVFYFACLTVTIHGLVLFGSGRPFKLDLGTLAVASQTNVGGGVSAMAMASARGYGDRLLPGVAVGLLGYARAIGSRRSSGRGVPLRARLVGIAIVSMCYLCAGPGGRRRFVPSLIAAAHVVERRFGIGEGAVE